MTTTTDRSERHRDLGSLLADIDALTQIAERLARIIALEVNSPMYPIRTQDDLGKAYHLTMNTLRRFADRANLSSY